MSVDRSDILAALARLQLPDGGDLISNDFIRAVTIDGGAVRFVIEAPNAEVARKLADIRGAAERLWCRDVRLYRRRINICCIEP